MRQVGEDFQNEEGERVRVSRSPGPQQKPWLDEKTDPAEIFFASIHGYGGGFYPGSGKTSLKKHLGGMHKIPTIVNVAVEVAGGSSGACSSADFRRQFKQMLLPRLIEFQPDLLFISAGFDGHQDDLIGQCAYKEADFQWATEQLLNVANVSCNGRVVSVLEGGYNTRAGYMSPFARSVRQHVRVLMGHNTEVKPEDVVQSHEKATKINAARAALKVDSRAIGDLDLSNPTAEQMNAIRQAAAIFRGPTSATERGTGVASSPDIAPQVAPTAPPHIQPQVESGKRPAENDVLLDHQAPDAKRPKVDPVVVAPAPGVVAPAGSAAPESSADADDPLWDGA